jgi:hypothetical protein
MRPQNQEVNITFYKTTGKYYSSGTAVVNHFLFEDEYKQDIVNTQNVMMDGWQGNHYVVVSSDDKADGFHEALFFPKEFSGIKKVD